MEDPSSWSPLDKAVAAAEAEFYKSIAICSGPEPLDVKASLMAQLLIKAKAVTTTDQKALSAVIEKTLEEQREAREKGFIGSSETVAVANAIVAAKMAG